jgi:hypothetical protein
LTQLLPLLFVRPLTTRSKGQLMSTKTSRKLGQMFLLLPMRLVALFLSSLKVNLTLKNINKSKRLNGLKPLSLERKMNCSPKRLTQSFWCGKQNSFTQTLSTWFAGNLACQTYGQKSALSTTNLSLSGIHV